MTKSKDTIFEAILSLRKALEDSRKLGYGIRISPATAATILDQLGVEVRSQKYLAKLRTESLKFDGLTAKQRLAARAAEDSDYHRPLKIKG